MRPNPGIRFEREGPLKAVGLLWTQEPNGGWRRHVIRRHEQARELIFSELFHVRDKSEFCLKCLAREVRVTLPKPEDVGAKPWFDCEVCGLHWWYVPEPGKLEG